VTRDGDELLYQSVGGNIHFVIVLGQADPEAVLEKYHDYIGRSHIPPFWSMGYHQSRWGYKSSSALTDVLIKFGEHDLPIDTIWSDLEYMDQKMIFTVNPLTHGGNSLNKMMKDYEVHFVPLLDVGVSTRDV
jgi:alpha-glucosidase (family GH31 glycosyl hydrolase)